MRASRGLGAGKGPNSKGAKGNVGSQGQAARGSGATGGGQGVGRGTRSGAPPQPDVQPVRCIPPGIQQMAAHHAHHHRDHHAHLYNIDLDAGDLVPPPPPRPPHQPPPNPHSGAPRGPAPVAPEPRVEPAGIAAAPAARGHGAAPAPQAQGPQVEPAPRAEGARDGDRDWDAIPNPLGGEALPLVMEICRWLGWVSAGTTRGMRNQPFDTVLLRRDRGNREVPPGGWLAQEHHERVLRSVIGTGSPNREPTWPAFLEGGAVLRVTDTEANKWLPRALRTAPTHWRYRRWNPLPPQPQRPHKRRRRRRPPPVAMVPGGGHSRVGKDQQCGTPPRQAWAAPHRAPPVPPRR